MSAIIGGFIAILNPVCILLMVIGVIVGIIFGAIPGLTSTMAVALFLPVTFGMSPVQAMSLLLGLYVGSVSGGLISAILLRIPGTPASIATCFDGHPLAERGEAVKALGVGIVFSFIGGFISFLALLFMSPILAKFAINFTPFEYFAVSASALTMIITLAKGNLFKGVASGMIGMLLATVGSSPIDGVSRLTFGFTELTAGFDLLPALIGFFAITEILSSAEKSYNETKIAQVSLKGIKGFGFSIKEFLSQQVNMLRSSIIGIGIGILPGVGGGLANVLAYATAKNQSKYPEKFGTGIIDGVVASETSNNASIGGAMIPLLTLGIPGDGVTAMLLGAFMIHGIAPGPMLFVTNNDLVYAIFAALFVSNFIMIILEFYGLRIFIKLLDVPKHILLSIVIVLCCVGAFGVSSRIFHIWNIIVFGLIGYAFSKFKFPISPIILGFILGPIAETNLRRGLMLSSGSWLPFLTRPISGFFIIVGVVSLFMSFRSMFLTYKSKKSELVPTVSK